MITDYTGTLLALVVGWLLSEGSHFLRYRSQKKQSVRLCLGDLLEIRHRIIGNELFFDLMEAHFKLGPRDLFRVRSLMPKPIQYDPEISKRLSSSIGNLARYAPFLACNLRGKDIVGSVEAAFNPEDPPNDETANHLLQAQASFRENILPELDRVIIATAWHSGWMDWCRAIKRVRIDPRVNKELRAKIDRNLSSMREQIDAQQSH